ncbi:MAG TPA: O-antigen ligase family protein [Thermoleophilaceae bacterium]
MEAGGRLGPQPLALTAEGLAGLSARAWLAWSVLIAAGAGVLAANNAQLALDLALLVIGVVSVLRWPLPVLLLAILVAPRHSPLIEILLAASCVVLLPRLVRAPGKALLLPLAAFLLLVLPGINFNGSRLTDSGFHSVFVIPGLGWEFLTRPSSELLSWIRVGYGFALALLAATAVRNPRHARLAFSAALIGAIQPLLSGFGELFSGTYVSKEGFNSVQGPFDHPNEFGFYLVIVLMLSVVALFELRNRWLRLGAGVLAIGALVMLQHTYTRSAWIGFALAFLVLALFQYRRLIVVAVVALAIALLAVPSAVDSVQARFGDLATQNASNAKNSLEWRRGQWERMTHFGDEKPLTGQGFGSYQRLTLEEFGFQDGTFSTIVRSPRRGVIGIGFSAHNDYVKLYVETGIPGVLLWLAAFVGIAITAISAARVAELRPWAVAIAALAAAFALMSASDNIQAYAVPLAILFALTGALAGAARRTARSSPSPAG